MTAKATHSPAMVGFRDDRFATAEARYWRDGVSAAEDYRYLAMYRYLKLSPSFTAVVERLRGRESLYPYPSDAHAVEPIAEDFQHVFDLDEYEWWKQHGKYLFGSTAPKPDAFLAGRLTVTNRAVTVIWDRNDGVVIRLAANQTKKDALNAVGKLIDDLIEKGKFGVTPQVPRYGFLKSRLREPALATGAAVLSYYLSPAKPPLWWIGNFCEVSPAHCFAESDVETLGKAALVERRNVLSVTTSRYVRYALLVAENAARGRFPCADPFPEAQLDLFQRTAGRPVGRKKTVCQ